MLSIRPHLHGYCSRHLCVCVDERQSNSVRAEPLHERADILWKPSAVALRVKVTDLRVERQRTVRRTPGIGAAECEVDEGGYWNGAASSLISSRRGCYR